MRDVELYRALLGLTAPWTVAGVEVDMRGQRVVVRVESGPGPYPCPECGIAGPRYDSKPRRWRHLDTMQFTTWIEADVPRMQCGTHGVKQRRDGRLTLDPRYCWLDTRAFDHCLTRAESAIRGHGATSNGWRDSAEWTEKALALYQGHFVANEPWAAPFAERLRNRLVRHLRQLGPHCDEAPVWQEAIASHDRVLAVHEGG